MIMIREIGAEYLGLGSLFSSILQVLNITELGFSSAVVYSMYKPIADEDYPLLCAIIKYYKKIYLIIGTYYFNIFYIKCQILKSSKFLYQHSV